LRFIGSDGVEHIVDRVRVPAHVIQPRPFLEPAMRRETPAFLQDIAREVVASRQAGERSEA
jgi:hypothetical protein